MSKHVLSAKRGLPPGTVVHVGPERRGTMRAVLIRYGEEAVVESILDDPTTLATRPPGPVSWIDVDGVHDVAVVEGIGRALGIHPLVLEDVAHTQQRAKVEEYPGHLYLVLRMFFLEEASDGPATLVSEQVSLVLGPDYLVSFQECPGDVFDPVRARIRGGPGRVRRAGPDWLAYSLLDAVVDGYFVVLEQVGERLEALEDAIEAGATRGVLRDLHALRRALVDLRRAAWPLREMVSGLMKGESPLVTETTRTWLRDVHDHAVQALETVDLQREMVASLLDLHLSLASNRLNEVMKLLTVIATIFIPLTFLAGVYGMNFAHMPELAWRWGYPAIWAIMLALGLGMAAWFRHKRWF